MSKRRKKKGFMGYIAIAVILVCIVIAVSSSVSNEKTAELVRINVTPTPTPTMSPTPSPTPIITPSPKPTVSPTPGPTPVLKYAGTTVKGISILQKSAQKADTRVYNIMSSIPEDGLPIPRFYQFNYRTPVCYYYGGRKTVASSGCGPTTISMIVAWIYKNYDQTPYTQMYYAAEIGDYYGQGLTVDAVEHILKLNNVVCWQAELSRENILDALEGGRACIMRMGPGVFTNAGHYIILRGIDEDGRILVNDPNSMEHSYTSYDISLIVRQAKRPTFVVIGALDEQTGVELSKEDGESIITVQQPISAVSIGFGTVLNKTTLYSSYGENAAKAARLDKGTVLEILDKVAVEGDDKLWYAVAYNGAQYYLRSDAVAAEWYQYDPDNTPAPDATDSPDPDTAA